MESRIKLYFLLHSSLFLGFSWAEFKLSRKKREVLLMIPVTASPTAAGWMDYRACNNFIR
jgi:hypothetical protein